MTDYITAPAAEFPGLGALRRHLTDTEGFVAGGVFKNIFERQPVKDIDVFFPSREAWAAAKKVLKKRGYKRIYKNARVVAFVDPIDGTRVELIGSDDESVEFNAPQETIERFDFTITKFALWAATGDDPEWKVTYHPQFFQHLQLKRLVIDAEMVKPFSTFERVLRYTVYGFRLCRESKVKLVSTLGETPFESEAQLSASFYQGID